MRQVGKLTAVVKGKPVDVGIIFRTEQSYVLGVQDMLGYIHINTEKKFATIQQIQDSQKSCTVEV